MPFEYLAWVEVYYGSLSIHPRMHSSVVNTNYGFRLWSCSTF